VTDKIDAEVKETASSAVKSTDELFTHTQRSLLMTSQQQPESLWMIYHQLQRNLWMTCKIWPVSQHELTKIYRKFNSGYFRRLQFGLMDSLTTVLIVTAVHALKPHVFK
jgi:hypothetical protein